MACHALKTGFELSSVKSCRHVPLKGSKTYFELVGGSSYRGFQLWKVKLQQMYDENPGAIDGSSKRELFRVSEDSSYRESTVVLGSSFSECCRFFKNESYLTTFFKKSEHAMIPCFISLNILHINFLLR